jgi:hypothetical protein
MSFPPLKSKIDPFIPFSEDKSYKPKTAEMEKIRKYKKVRFKKNKNN